MIRCSCHQVLWPLFHYIPLSMLEADIDLINKRWEVRNLGELSRRIIPLSMLEADIDLINKRWEVRNLGE